MIRERCVAAEIDHNAIRNFKLINRLRKTRETGMELVTLSPQVCFAGGGVVPLLGKPVFEGTAN